MSYKGMVFHSRDALHSLTVKYPKNLVSWRRKEDALIVGSHIRYCFEDVICLAAYVIKDWY